MTKAPTALQRLNFAQREFGAALPQQMKRDEITRALRVQLFATTRNHVELEETLGEPDKVAESWYDILYDVHVEHLERMPDEFDDDWRDQDATLRQVFEKGTAVQVYGFLEFILRHPSCPNNFAAAINAVLVKTQAAFRIVDGDTLAPFASEEEGATVIAAVADLGEPQFVGAKDHYKKAVSALSSADYAASMRESIHAVESVTKALTGESTVQKGVKALASKGHLHVTLSDALEKVAAWTNAEAGVRHANEPSSPKPNVTEADALYLLQIGGSTISYLKRIAIAKGLLK